MQTFEFKYGNGTVSLDLPNEANVQVLRGSPTPAIKSIPAALATALEHSVGGINLAQFLHPGDKVTLIISDMSRFWMRQDLVIPHLVDYMFKTCGIAPADLIVLVANGTHIGGDEAELRTLVTDAVFDTVAVKNHDCLAPDHICLGTTTRGTEVEVNPLAVNRKVVALGAATQHVMAGFGGGRKSILPGICSQKSIRQNHLHSLDPLSARSNPAIGNGVLNHNPLHEDMCEAAAMVQHLYVVNLVMNPEMQLAKITAGHWHDSWLEACKAVEAMYAVPVGQKADILITSCGGFPKDMSLYQGTKTIDNVESGLKPGGTLVLVAECREGGGPAEYFDWTVPLQAGILDAELRKNFTIPGYIFYLNCEQAQRYQIRMLTTADPKQVGLMGIEATPSPAQVLAGIDFAGKLTYVVPSGSTVVPQLEQEA